MVKSPVRQIGRRMLKLMLAFSLVLTVVLAAIQATIDFRARLASIDKVVEQIQSTQIDAITDALWSWDIRTVAIQASGILHFPYLSYVAISDRGHIFYEAGEKRSNNIAERTVDLVHRDETRTESIGIITIQIDRGKVIRDTLSDVMRYTIGICITIFVISIFFMTIFDRLVTRHLSHAARFLERFDFSSLENPLRLHRSQYRQAPDEIDILVDAFNGMREKLFVAYNRQRDLLVSLQESEERYRRIFSSAREGILGVNSDGLIAFVNPMMSELLGYGADELIGRPKSDFMFKEDIVEYHRMLEGRGNNFTQYYERRFCHKDCRFQL